MVKISEFVKRAEALAKKLGNTHSTLSLKLFNDGNVLPRLRAGGRVYAHVLERGFDKLVELEAEARRTRAKPPVK